MACGLCVTKPLFDLILAKLSLEPWEQISVNKIHQCLCMNMNLWLNVLTQPTRNLIRPEHHIQLSSHFEISKFCSKQLPYCLRYSKVAKQLEIQFVYKGDFIPLCQRRLSPDFFSRNPWSAQFIGTYNIINIRCNASNVNGMTYARVRWLFLTSCG